MHLQKFFKRSKIFFFFLNPAGLDIMNYRLLAEIKIALGHKEHKKYKFRVITYNFDNSKIKIPNWRHPSNRSFTATS